VHLTCVGPLPPVRSGVADYGAQLLTYLRPHCDMLTAVVDEYKPELAWDVLDNVESAANVRSSSWSDDCHVRLYHMGCQPSYHGYVYEMLRSAPGVTVLHDGNLLPFVHALTVERGDRAAFVREAGFERGSAGARAAWAALRGGEALEPEVFPMIARVARSSLGVIVHSSALLARVHELAPTVPAIAVPHLDLRSDAERDSPRVAKSSVGFQDHDVLIGAFGFIATSRRLEQALCAFARVSAEYPRARFVCVGEPIPQYDFADALARLGLAGKVKVTGYVPHDDLIQYLRAVDIGVNLRWPTWGEMSGTLMRLMAFGVPTLVTDAGAFAELPDAAVVKIGLDSGEVDQIAETLCWLLEDAGARRAIGDAAQAYVSSSCNPTDIAHRYVKFIRDVTLT
jgi:glycosyltransferase involved in cell wall biosynthesis